MNSLKENWLNAINKITLDYFIDEIENQDLLIDDLLIKYNINQNQLLANAEFMKRGMIEIYDGIYRPSDSIFRFGSESKRPRAYPLWFFAAFPDVASWYISDPNKTTNLICKATNKTEDYFEKEYNYVDRKLSFIFIKQLISYYSESTNKLQFECSRKPITMMDPEMQSQDIFYTAQDLFMAGRGQEALEKLNHLIEIFPLAKGYLLRGLVKLELKQLGCVDIQKAIDLGFYQAEEAYDKFCD